MDDKSIGRLRMRFALSVVTTVLAASCGDRTTDHPNSNAASSSSAAERYDIRRTPVSSSALRSVGYDQEQQVLEIEFTSGAVYQYFDVPAEVYRGLMAAESHGRYFHQHVRDNSYRYQRMK